MSSLAVIMSVIIMAMVVMPVPVPVGFAVAVVMWGHLVRQDVQEHIADQPPHSKRHPHLPQQRFCRQLGGWAPSAAGSGGGGGGDGGIGFGAGGRGGP